MININQMNIEAIEGMLYPAEPSSQASAAV